MAQYLTDNYTQIAHNGAYGNKSTVEAQMAAFSTGIVAADTLDLVKVPGGARILSGFTVIATAVTTATTAIGVRYADGTSTGGTTGTAVMGTQNIAVATQQGMNFVPFVNDADTIIYATYVNGGTPGANIAFSAVVDYIATGQK